MRLHQLAATLLVAIVALVGTSCDKPQTEAPVNKPTIGILDPTFDHTTMSAKVMIAPSTDATAWYWCVTEASETSELNYTKVEGAAAQEIEFKATYGVEYAIKAYAENKAGKSDIAEKRFCAMPEGEVAVALGEVTLHEESMHAMITVYPSKATTKWYWGVVDSEDESAQIEWTADEYTNEKVVTFNYEWGKRLVFKAYAECGTIPSDVVSKEVYFAPAIPTISVSKPHFDEAAMSVSFDVTPSEDTDHWYWGIYDDALDANYNVEEGSEAKSVEFKVEYDKEYQFIFRAENAINEGEEKIVEFYVISPVADITIENLTAYTLDAVVSKKEHCVRYVAGAVHTSAFDRNIFIEQAQSSLNPDPSYPFAVFNSATESRTFSEQDLVRNSRTDSSESAGIMLTSGTSYTIAVYGEDANGYYNVTTKEVTIPAAEINGNIDLTIEMGEITETSAIATVSAAEPCKLIMGCVDPEITKADTEDPFDFTTASEEEIKEFLATTARAVPSIYSEPITRMLGDRLAIDHTYFAYAIAVKDGKIGEVTYTEFKTKRPSLTGIAKITGATIEPQTTHEILSVKLTTDQNATKVRLYAAPSNDHLAYADTLEFVMDADSYQNYREEYEVVDGVATGIVDVYHPGDNYYIYASAVDASGRAGEMVCVARMAGYDTDYYTTMEEIIEEGSLSYNGTGSATLTASDIKIVDERVNVTLTATNFSSNVDKVWFMRLASCKIADIENEVKSNLEDYAEKGKIYGSYKIVKEGWAYKYVDDLENSFDPKFEALLQYSTAYGGDIIVMVILDTAGKVNIHSYFAGGIGVTEM
ncbi:MAG: hypothetical protein U0L61_02660 [Alistipes sp.]|nr:hypothetical protein [Alistipes sp.]